MVFVSFFPSLFATLFFSLFLTSFPTEATTHRHDLPCFLYLLPRRHRCIRLSQDEGQEEISDEPKDKNSIKILRGSPIPLAVSCACLSLLFLSTKKCPQTNIVHLLASASIHPRVSFFFYLPFARVSSLSYLSSIGWPIKIMTTSTKKYPRLN